MSTEELLRVEDLTVHYTTLIGDVVFPAAMAGIEAEGTGYRMDAVPIRMKKVKQPPNENILTDKEILEKILKKVKELRK